MSASTTDVLVHRVISRLNVGGPARHVVHLTRRLNDGAPFRTRLLAGRVGPEEGDMSYLAGELGVDVTTIPSLAREVRPFRDARAFWRLFRWFRREKPTIVHTHTSKAGALGRLAALLAGVPVRIHTFHGHVFRGGYFGAPTTRLYRRIERLMASISTRIVVLAESQKRDLSQEFEVAPPGRFEVVPLGLDLEPFAAYEGADRERTRAEMRDELGLASEQAVVGIVGRLVPVKNHELLFDAVPRLLELLRRSRGTPELPKAGVTGGGASDAGPARDLVVLVVGSGKREEELREYVRGLGVADRVRFLGWRRDLPRLYTAMDALALTSGNEGTPVAVIEAMAAGVPVVARDVGGVREVLERGRWGRLVAWPDPAELAERLLDTLRDPLDDAEVRAMRASVLERFGVGRMVRDVRELYRRELEGI